MGGWTGYNAAGAGGAPVFLFLIKGWESSVGQGTWVTSTGSNGLFEMYFDNSSAVANLDNITFTAKIPVGSYKVGVVAYKNNASGILKVYCNGTERFSQDLYAASATWNNVYVSSAFSVTSSDSVPIKIEVNGKNGSSSNYRVTLQGLIFIPQ